MNDQKPVDLQARYAPRHLIAAAILSPAILFLVSQLLSFLVDATSNKTIDMLSQLVACLVVTIFYSLPFRTQNPARLADIKVIQRRLVMFALTGFVAFMVSPLLFPKGSLQEDVATVNALTTFGLSTILIIPISLAMNTLLIVIARHFGPVKATD